MCICAVSNGQLRDHSVSASKQSCSLPFHEELLPSTTQGLQGLSRRIWNPKHRPVKLDHCWNFLPSWSKGTSAIVPLPLGNVAQATEALDHCSAGPSEIDPGTSHVSDLEFVSMFKSRHLLLAFWRHRELSVYFLIPDSELSFCTWLPVHYVVID